MIITYRNRYIKNSISILNRRDPGIDSDFNIRTYSKLVDSQKSGDPCRVSGQNLFRALSNFLPYYYLLLY